MSLNIDYVVWLITARCNLDCKHCYAKPYLHERELSRREKLLLAKQLSEIGIPHVCISGGEPLLLGEDLLDIVKIFREHDIDVSIVTNGTVLNESLINKLISLEVFFYVSLDGNKIGHESLRGSGTWDRALHFLKYLSSRTSYFGTVMALSSLNYRYVEAYVSITMKLNPASISFIPVMPYGRARETHVYITVQELREAIKLIEKAIAEHRLVVTMWCLPCLRAYTTCSNIRYGKCRGRKVFDISPSGSLLLCDVTGIEVCRWSPERHMRDLVIEYFSSSIVERAQKIPSECAKCNLVESCGGGCYARSYQIYGQFDKRDPLCPL